MSKWIPVLFIVGVLFAALLIARFFWNRVFSRGKIVSPSYTNSLGMDFVKIPGGTFEMGNQDLEKPVHTVTLSTFYLMNTEVTNKQFSVFKNVKRSKYSYHDKMPACSVTRKEIDEFIEWLSKKDKKKYSLPTEAQWEYAARGGTKNLHFHWGNSFDTSMAKIGTDGFGGNATASIVKSYPPNNYGIHDMIGNVSEAVFEGYYDYSATPAIDPKGKPPKGELDGIERGQGIGSFFPFVWFRSPYDPDARDREVGFRLVVQLDR